MTEPEDNATTAEDPAINSPGRQLREGRDARGLTQQEIAVKLHLHQRMVAALEDDDFDQLPSPIYVRGYLRNYARLLGLDPKHIVAAYDGSESEHPELKPPLQAPSQASSSDKPVKAVTYLVTLVLVLLLLAWWQSRNISEDSFIDLDNLQISNSEEQLKTPADSHSSGEEMQASDLGYPIKVIRHPDSTFYPLPSEGPAPDTTATQPDTPVADTTDTATTPAELLETLPEPAGGGDNTAAADTGGNNGNDNETSPATDGDAGLQLDLTEESWIEVYDASGQRLYLGLGEAGETIQLDGETPLRVLLGFAPGVEVSYNGEPIDTIEHSSAGVAQFTVGQ